jgi:hypothetical protein
MASTTEKEEGGARPRRRPAHRIHWQDDDGSRRHLMPAGHVWVIGLVCLLVGALLNAPGIRKTALGQPVGWKRDVATFFANPLYDVSHALYLDRLRLGLQDLIGRGGQDDVNFSLPSPTVTVTPTTVPGVTTTTAPKPAFSPSHQVRLWVGGDSLSITPGESVINQAVATQVIGILEPVDGHVATGLARPEVFNWPAYLADVIARDTPDAMVLPIGSNDDQTLTGEGGVGPLLSDAWQTEYRRRVGGLMDEVTGSGKVTLFWVGIPQMRNFERYEQRYKFINDIIRTEAAKRPGHVYFVDTASLVVGPDGGYTDFITNADGTVVKVRSSDGIHFERAGADIVATAVLTTMNQAFDLTSWQKGTSTTTTSSGATTTSPGAATTTTSKPRKRRRS